MSKKKSKKWGHLKAKATQAIITITPPTFHNMYICTITTVPPIPQHARTNSSTDIPQYMHMYHNDSSTDIPQHVHLYHTSSSLPIAVLKSSSSLSSQTYVLFLCVTGLFRCSSVQLFFNFLFRLSFLFWISVGGLFAFLYSYFFLPSQSYFCSCLIKLSDRKFRVPFIYWWLQPHFFQCAYVYEKIHLLLKTIHFQDYHFRQPTPSKQQSVL
jgi:hypothetical protein